MAALADIPSVLGADLLRLQPRPELRALMDEIAEQRGAQTLARALSMAEGFHFAIVTCKSSRSAAALQLWLAEALSSEHEGALSIERVSPDPLDPLAAGPGMIEPGALAKQVFAGLLPAGQTEASAGSERVVFLDATRGSSASLLQWRALFMRLNERRNLLLRDLGGSLTLLLPELFELELPRAAPDLWSIRSLSVTLDEPVASLPVARVLIQAHDSAFSSGEDPTALTLEVDRLRRQATGGSPVAKRALRVMLLRLVGAYRRLGKLDESLACVEEAEQIARALGDRDALAACWMARSELLVGRGELDEAEALLREAVGELERGEDRWTRAGALGQVADILQSRGELDEALRIRREEQLPVYERLGDVRSWAVTMGKVADILQSRGELDEALRIRREEELPVYERLGDVRGRAVTMGKVADILQSRGELDEALRIRREEELPVYARLGDVRSRAIAMGKVANILQSRGELDEALRIRREEELPVYARLGDVRSQLIARAYLAESLAERGRPGDVAEVVALLTSAMRDARKLRLRSDIESIAQFIRQLGRNPDEPPFA